MFCELGADIIDADQLARDVVEPGTPCLAEIEAYFGSDILHDDGSLNRKKLGALVFSDASALEALNKMTHARIAEAGQRVMLALAEQGKHIVLYEAALIVENGLHETMHGLIVVSLPEEQQILRLKSRDNIDQAAAKARIDSQFPLAQKLKVATYVIDNSKSKAHTHSQVAQTWRQLQEAV